MPDTLNTIAQLSGLVLLVGSMLAMGLSLTVAQIIQPLKNTRLVVLALVANFIIVPALAYGITAVSHICVSHDWHLFLIKEQYLHLRSEDHEFIQFLEGMVIYEKNGRYYIINHQTGAQQLPIIV